MHLSNNYNLLNGSAGFWIKVQEFGMEALGIKVQELGMEVLGIRFRSLEWRYSGLIRNASSVG